LVAAPPSLPEPPPATVVMIPLGLTCSHERRPEHSLGCGLGCLRQPADCGHRQ
jgi:hypothetical protein